ncbi:hypothetical protein PVL29_014452 [Vitis rotundifolia]|uniref:EF-hand domain-containing protein n=1 Tax=Vitis rotundifolia TaxID=103349 RepID=A0AA39DL41_VITRO|nr:hypothetical protein PVL29_014452 [Vitis rotundifolia]
MWMAPLRKSSPSIRRVLIAPSLFNKSEGSSRPLRYFGGSSYDEDKGPGSLLKMLVRWLSSGVLIVGPSLGFCYCSSSDATSLFSFADCSNVAASATQDHGLRHSDSPDSIPVKKPKYLFGDAYRKEVYFKYEKRIRMRSPPEKVFEYFASFRAPNGEVFMTPADLMRAVVPVFPPSESDYVRYGSLRGERVPSDLRCAASQFFMLFDTDNDGLISFPEYIFFVTLLSIPESSFSVAFKMFDLDNNGEIDREEFRRVMALMRSHNRQGAQHRDGLRIGLKVGGSVENGGLLEYFFGKDGKSCLKHEAFVQFLRDFHDEILRLEFAHYDYKSRGTISANDFALSMVASADMRHINKFLCRVDDLNDEPQLRDIRITLEEFKNFAELRKRLQPLSWAIFSYGKVNGQLTKGDFQRAACQVCGISLTDNVVDIIFHIFDANRDGSLSLDEFVRVLQRRERDTSQPREPGFMGLLSCWLSCTTNCSSSNIFLN